MAGGVIGGVVGGVLGGTLGGTGSGAPLPPEKPKFVPPAVMERQRAHTVEPIWPPAAKAAGITGEVLLKACTDAEGNVVDVQIVRGNAVFDDAAVTAVRQWRYRPYMVDDRPTALCGIIKLRFSFD